MKDKMVPWYKKNNKKGPEEDKQLVISVNLSYKQEFIDCLKYTTYKGYIEF